MMKNKGFTLIELVAIIALLGSIFLITYTEVNQSLEKSENQLSEVQKSNIKASSQNWAVDNLNKLPKESGKSCNVNLQTLQNEGYIEESIKNPKKKREEITNVYVQISKKNDNYIYKVLEGTSQTTCKDE